MDIQNELIAEYDRETASTRKMLEAIPDELISPGSLMRSR